MSNLRTGALHLLLAASLGIGFSGSSLTGIAQTLPATTSAPATRPAFTLSQETTRIVTPLLPDGRPDYVKAIDDEIKVGVTPENNIMVTIFEVVGTGPDIIHPKIHDASLAKLGIKEQQTSKIEHLANYCKKHNIPYGDELSKTEDACRAEPWSVDDQPIIADWLKENEQSLDLFVKKAAGRDRCYWPLIATTDRAAMISVSLPSLGPSRNIANMLCTRAMLRLHEGKISEAQTDLLTAHRLGRLLTRGPTIIQQLVGYAIENMATKGELALADYIAPADNKKFMTNLSLLPSRIKVTYSLEKLERFMILDTILAVQKYGFEFLGPLFGLEGEKSPKPLIYYIDRTKVKWDEILKEANSWYDRQIAAINLPTFAQRRTASSKLEAETMAFIEQENSIAVNTDPTRKVSNYLLGMLLPSLGKAAEIYTRTEQDYDLTVLAFTLAAYHADHKAYPETLDKLVPNYLKTIPTDVFSGEALIYRKEGAGYTLYSIGPNLQDDGGTGKTDYKKGDIIVTKSK